MSPNSPKSPKSPTTPTSPWGSITSSDSQVKTLSNNLRRRERKSCLINPDTNPYLRKWDVVQALSLLFVCFVVPYEVGFQTFQERDEQNVTSLVKRADARFWMNRLVDLVFLVDMVLQFFIMYPIKHQYGYYLVLNHHAIARNYMSSWFAVDLLSMIPFDILGVLVQSDSVSRLKLLRVLRLLRLLKLVRLFRGSRLLQKWQVEMSWSYRKLTVWQLLVTVILATHWFSCLLGILNSINGKPTCIQPDDSGGCEITWLSQHVESVEYTDGVVDHWTSYLIALHVAASIVVHPHQTQPTSNAERICFAMFLFCGGFIWTRVISKSTAIATSMGRHKMLYHQNMDDLNIISKSLGLPKKLRKRLRAFFMNTEITQQQHTWKGLVGMMSPSLQETVVYRLNRCWLRNVPYLARAGKHLIRELATQLQTLNIAQCETFGANFTLYILNRGVCSWTKDVKKVVILTAGSVWGEEHLLLNDPRILRPNTAHTLTFVECLFLERQAFKKICMDNPDYAKEMRPHYLWYLFFRKLIYESQKIKQQSEPLLPEPSCETTDYSKQWVNNWEQLEDEKGRRSLATIQAHYKKAQRGLELSQKNGSVKEVTDSFSVSPSSQRKQGQKVLLKMASVSEATDSFSVGGNFSRSPKINDSAEAATNPAEASISDRFDKRLTCLENHALQMENLMITNQSLMMTLVQSLSKFEQRSEAESAPTSSL